MDPSGSIPEKIIKLEMETRQKVSASISAIEVALTEWDTANKKPLKLAKKIESLRAAYDLLTSWEIESLKGKNELATVLQRLRRFNEMCEKLGATKN